MHYLVYVGQNDAIYVLCSTMFAKTNVERGTTRWVPSGKTKVGWGFALF